MASGSAAPDAGSAAFDHGELMNLEQTYNWEVGEIGFDGGEKFYVPQQYLSYISELAEKVDWMQLIADEADYDNPQLMLEKERAAKKREKQRSRNAMKNKPEEREVPEAGPWHVVAKNLHDSLQEINVLLDNIAILQRTDYVKAMRVKDPVTEYPAHGAEIVAASKGFQWIAKRRALEEGRKMVEVALSERGKASSDANPKQRDNEKFFQELRKMRELYKVRKHGETIVGDLGYKQFGNRIDNRGIFDITRRDLKKGKEDEARIDAAKDGEEEGGRSMLIVKVPGDLMRRTLLSVSIVRDDTFGPGGMPEYGDEAFAYLQVDPKDAEKVPWEKALQYAQETLIAKDIFNNIFSDAVALKRRLAVVRDGIVFVSIFDDYLIRIERQYFPFTTEDIPAEGDPYLTRLLHEYHLAREATRKIRPQMLVDLPLTVLPETLDSRGPLAYTVPDVNSRFNLPLSLLSRMIRASGHYHLVKEVVEVMQSHTILNGDPQVKWRWVRTSPIISVILVEMTNRNYDHVIGKITYFIRIDADSIKVVTKDSAEINCRRDCKELRQALHLMNAIFYVHTVTALAKVANYQILHTNMNAMDPVGIPAPTVYMVNASSTRSLYIVFPLAEYPVVYTRPFLAHDTETMRMRRERELYGGVKSDYPMETDEELIEKEKFLALNYARIPGRSMCKKFDVLFAVLR